MKVKVGKEYPDGVFEGEEVEFEGREVEVWEGPRLSIDPTAPFLVTTRLYECPMVTECMRPYGRCPTTHTTLRPTTLFTPWLGTLATAPIPSRRLGRSGGSCSRRCNRAGASRSGPSSCRYNPPQKGRRFSPSSTDRSSFRPRLRPLGGFARVPIRESGPGCRRG